MTTGAAALHVCLQVRLDSVPFRTLFASPLLFTAVLSAIVFSDAHKVTERMAGVVMQTGLHRAYVNALEHLRSPPLRQCPRYLSQHIQLQRPSKTNNVQTETQTCTCCIYSCSNQSPIMEFDHSIYDLRKPFVIGPSN